MAENPSDLVGKEFIFEYGVDRIFPPSEETGGLFTTEQRAYRRERVVRCRDCARSFEERGELWCRRIVGPPVDLDGFCAWGSERVMEKISPCRCGSAPYFTPYEQSTDGNHDTPASVTCRTCGRSTVMDWHLWREAEGEVGDEKYAKPTAYLSARFMDALGDATIRKWNRENGGE